MRFILVRVNAPSCGETRVRHREKGVRRVRRQRFRDEVRGFPGREDIVPVWIDRILFQIGAADRNLGFRVQYLSREAAVKDNAVGGGPKCSI